MLNLELLTHKHKLIETLEEDLDIIMNNCKVPGLSIAVINNYNIELLRAYGYLNSNTNITVSVDTLFQAGSISKSITAAAIMSLYNDKFINLDDDVNKHLYSWKIPQNGEWQPIVTIRQLLNHTSGICLGGFGGYLKNKTIPNLIHILNGTSPAITPQIKVNIIPGTQYSYSGGGYCVLQQLICDVTKNNFPDAIKELVFNPLDMQNSTFAQLLPEEELSNFAVGHYDDGMPLYSRYLIYPESAAAGLWSTSMDIAKFVLELQLCIKGKSKKLFSTSIANEMITCNGRNMGLGVFVYGTDTCKTFSHTGINMGFESKFLGFADNGCGFVGMSNSQNGMQIINTVIKRLATYHNWPGYTEKAVSINTAFDMDISEYLGDYILNNNIRCSLVRIDNSNIYLDMPNQNLIPLQPIELNMFKVSELNATLIFNRNADNEIISLTIIQNGERLEASRI